MNNIVIYGRVTINLDEVLYAFRFTKNGREYVEIVPRDIVEHGSGMYCLPLDGKMDAPEAKNSDLTSLTESELLQKMYEGNLCEEILKHKRALKEIA